MLEKIAYAALAAVIYALAAASVVVLYDKSVLAAICAAMLGAAPLIFLLEVLLPRP